MNGVWFDDLHMGYTTDFLMNYARVSTPIAKIKEIEVPGMNGVLDITESLGDVKYGNRQIGFKFTTREYAKIENLINQLHGRKRKSSLTGMMCITIEGAVALQIPCRQKTFSQWR